MSIMTDSSIKIKPFKQLMFQVSNSAMDRRSCFAIKYVLSKTASQKILSELLAPIR